MLAPVSDLDADLHAELEHRARRRQRRRPRRASRSSLADLASSVGNHAFGQVLSRMQDGEGILP